MSIAENIQALRERIERAAERSGRSPGDVKLVAISKGFSPEAIKEAVKAGVQDIGENRVQEAEAKIRYLRAFHIRPLWHLVGHLQTNKVKLALELFDIVQSVDSIHLAEAISKRAQRNIPILLEVNVAGETSKFGFSPDEAMKAVETIASMSNLDVRGLMTVAPVADDPEDVRYIFKQLREMSDALGLTELSMGMTDDFEVAIEEGATIVRLGRAVFGERPIVEGA